MALSSEVVPPESLAGKKVLVMGLGRFGGGVGVTRWLVGEGAQVIVNDAAPAEQLGESLKKLEELPGESITLKLGGHDPADFVAADLLVINPAVDKAASPAVQAALAKGVPYTTEMNLFVQRCPGLTIGVTGSVGKSTTTTLIDEALRAGFTRPQTQPSALSTQDSPSVFLGGNIGKSLLLDLPNIRPQDVVVLELSSFMLEETARVRWSPNIAVITNIFPNHLDRHHTMAAYSAAKQNILKFQTSEDVAIFNNDHDLVARWAHFARGRVIKYTTRGPSKLPLVIPGEHNQSNARAALAVLEALPSLHEFDRQAALEAIAQFPGLAHRLQLVHTLTLASGRRLMFYNDSKATTPDASITALRAFEPRSAIFIVGGYDKHIDLSAFEKLLAERAGGAIGIGQTGQGIIERTAALGLLTSERLTYSGSLEAAVRMALEWAREDSGIQAVVLSPASASWGQFTNYEERGEAFAGFARALWAQK